MIRLTELREDGQWSLKGVGWEDLCAGITTTKKEAENLYGAICKLKDYEDTGLNPDKVEQMKYDLEDLNNFMKSEAAKLLIELQEERRKYRWVTVDEQLPGTDSDYLVTMVIPGYNQSQPVTNWLHWNNCDKVWEETNGDPITEKVTAWKPIPEAYKEEDEGSD